MYSLRRISGQLDTSDVKSISTSSHNATGLLEPQALSLIHSKEVFKCCFPLQERPPRLPTPPPATKVLPGKKCFEDDGSSSPCRALSLLSLWEYRLSLSVRILCLSVSVSLSLKILLSLSLWENTALSLSENTALSLSLSVKILLSLWKYCSLCLSVCLSLPLSVFFSVTI